MTDELRSLWLLQGLDERLAVLRAALARFDVERRDLEKRLAEERTRVEQAGHRLHDLQLARRKLETEAETAGAEERKFQSQLPSVKKNEEYQALLHEIAAAKQRRSDVETRILELMDSEEASRREKAVAEATLKREEAEAGERRARADAEEAGERERLGEVEAERRVVVEGLPAALRSRYERIHGSREGKAVVPIQKNARGGCFRQQPPHVIQEARRRDRVLVCEGCGRLLVFPPDEA